MFPNASIEPKTGGCSEDKDGIAVPAVSSCPVHPLSLYLAFFRFSVFFLDLHMVKLPGIVCKGNRRKGSKSKRERKAFYISNSRDCWREGKKERQRESERDKSECQNSRRHCR